jgi:hypothetical protein
MVQHSERKKTEDLKRARKTKSSRESPFSEEEVRRMTDCLGYLKVPKHEIFDGGFFCI